MIEIEVDGKPLQVEQGSMIIEAADNAGIYIPRFCYHKKLSIAANCRMCLVEVEKAPKPLPACATPVTAGMKIYTSSAKAKDAQRSVMEFLLINHPLDCPICDQGGECELQDLSMGYGRDNSRFTEGKRAVADENLGPLIATAMTRCIQCTRCVRFGQEVAGFRELGATGRGEHMEIGTYIKHSMESELSGNIVDLCPVGALTSKPYLFRARAWELTQQPTIAPHDCMGTNLYAHYSKTKKIMRVVPRENESINETWITDRDRFSYTGLQSPDRLQQPMIKIADQWQTTDWVTALEFAVTGLKAILHKQGAKQIAALVSPSAPTEELYLLQKLLRELGCANIDHRLHQTDFADQEQAALYPNLGIKIAELEAQNTILLIGANIQREQPLAAHRVRKATLRGAQVFSVNVVDYPVNFEQAGCIICAPNKLSLILAGIAKALAETSNHPLPPAASELLKNIQPSAAEKNLAAELAKGEQKLILLGAIAQNHPEAATLRSLAQLIAQLSGAQFGCLTEGANSAGAWLAGAIPHRAAAGMKATETGLNAHAALAAGLAAYLLWDIEPELDCSDSALAVNALRKAEFVIACSPFKTDFYLQHANVILPIAAFTETEGSFVNVEGKWQHFAAAVPPLGEARPGWKVLRVLANQLDINGFAYDTAEQIRAELQQLLTTATVKEQWWHPSSIKMHEHKLMRITEWPIYAIDSLVRRAIPLQQSATNNAVAIYINANMATQLRLDEGMLATAVQGEARVQLSVTIDPRIPDNCVWVPAGCAETVGLGAAFGAIEIHV